MTFDAWQIELHGHRVIYRIAGSCPPVVVIHGMVKQPLPAKAGERVRIGENHRSQLSFGEGAVIVGDVRNERRPPRPGEVTHSVLVRVDDANAHCECARAHGARVDAVADKWDFTRAVDASVAPLKASD